MALTSPYLGENTPYHIGNVSHRTLHQSSDLTSGFIWNIVRLANLYLKDNSHSAHYYRLCPSPAFISKIINPNVASHYHICIHISNRKCLSPKKISERFSLIQGLLPLTGFYAKVMASSRTLFQRHWAWSAIIRNIEQLAGLYIKDNSDTGHYLR